jgi:hypothetical protein
VSLRKSMAMALLAEDRCGSLQVAARRGRCKNQAARKPSRRDVHCRQDRQPSTPYSVPESVVVPASLSSSTADLPRPRDEGYVGHLNRAVQHVAARL